MQHFQIGDVVRHETSLSEGTVTEIRADKYGYFVRWNDKPERNDWYRPEVLVTVRGSVPPIGNPTISLSSLGQGAIGISNSAQSAPNELIVEDDTQFPFNK